MGINVEFIGKGHNRYSGGTERVALQCGEYEIWERINQRFRVQSYFVRDPRSEKKYEFILDPPAVERHCPENPGFCETMADVLLEGHFLLLAENIDGNDLNLWFFQKRLPLGRSFMYATYRDDGDVGPGIDERGMCFNPRSQKLSKRGTVVDK